MTQSKTAPLFTHESLDQIVEERKRREFLAKVIRVMTPLVEEAFELKMCGTALAVRSVTESANAEFTRWVAKNKSG